MLGMRAEKSGEGGIRTLGTLLGHTRFPIVHLRPLGHLSKDGPKIVKNRSGESGIRTHGTLAGTLDFESSAFDHSAISP